jgi:PAS domain S-box-containing protein
MAPQDARIVDTNDAKAALQKILQLQASLIELAHDAILIRDPASTIVSWNCGAEELYGWTAQEAIGQITHGLLKTQFPESREALDRLLASGERWQGELVHTRRDGTQVIVESRQVLVRDDQGRPTAILEINRDITERKQQEQENQEQWRFLAEVSKILSSTLDYQKTLANIARLVVPQLADWFAVDLVDAQGRFELIEIDHADPQKVQWARTLRERFPIDPNSATGLPHVIRTGQSELYPHISDEMLVAATRSEEELAIARQVGYTSAMSVPLVARGKIIGVVSFVSAESGKHYDEHDLALAEEVGRRAGIALDNARLYREMAQARDQLEIILQGAADGIIVYEKNGQITYVNEAAAPLTGYPSAPSMLGTSLDNLLNRYTLIDEHGHPFPLSHLPSQRIAAGEREAQAVVGYTNSKTGKPDRWLSIKSRPVLDEHGAALFVVTIIHDLTERMLAERRKDEFISMTSHELKTPITSLKGFTNVLQRRIIKQGDEQTLHYLARMDVQLNKLTKLISDLLDISRMQSGKLDLQIEPFDLDTFIHETVENLQAATLTHRLLVEGRADARIAGDKDRLEQVFINLITNAVKYSPRADKVIVCVSRDSEQAIISVQDFGMGIAEVHHQKIFESFYQVTDPEEKTFPGLGIGLHIAHEIVERHSGRIWVESRKGEGATFFVSLPLLKAPNTNQE